MQLFTPGYKGLMPILLQVFLLCLLVTALPPVEQGKRPRSPDANDGGLQKPLKQQKTAQDHIPASSSGPPQGGTGQPQATKPGKRGWTRSNPTVWSDVNRAPQLQQPTLPGKNANYDPESDLKLPSEPSKAYQVDPAWNRHIINVAKWLRDAKSPSLDDFLGEFYAPFTIKKGATMKQSQDKKRPMQVPFSLTGIPPVNLLHFAVIKFCDSPPKKSRHLFQMPKGSAGTAFNEYFALLRSYAQWTNDLYDRVWMLDERRLRAEDVIDDMAAIWIFVNYLARKGKNYLPRRTTDRKGTTHASKYPDLVAFEEDLHKDLIEALRKFGVSVLETSNPQRSLGVEGVAEDADAQEDAADTDADADADAATAAVPADLDNDRVNIHLAALDRDLYVMLVSYVKKRGLTPNGNFVANGLFDIVSMFDKAQRDHTRNPLSPDDVSFETEEKILELAIYCWQRRSRYAGIDFKQVRINFSFHWYGYPTTSLKSLSLTEALESARQEQASAFDSFKKAVDKYHSFLEGSELKASIHKLPIGYISDPAATAAQGLGMFSHLALFRNKPPIPLPAGSAPHIVVPNPIADLSSSLRRPP